MAMRERLRFYSVLGLALLSFLAPLKFSLPVVFYNLQIWPSGLMEWLIAMWPETLFYAGFALLFMIGIAAMTPQERRPRWMLLPALFVGVQLLAALAGIDLQTSLHVLFLMLSVVLGFWLGGTFLRSEREIRWVLLAWVLASVFVAWKGISDATGGLEETRQYLQMHPEIATGNPELWHKVQSNRIFSTFVYPNALGGFIICALWIIAAWMFLPSEGTKEFDMLRRVAAGVIGMALLYCLWKSGSKGSYASLVATGMVLLLTRFRRWKGMLPSLIVLLLLAMGIFAVGYGRVAVEMGRRTLEARLDYWQAALKIGWDHPFLGSGPGAFAKLYPQYKSAAAESTRLTHNLYLQMWSDSGLIGLLTCIAFFPGILIQWFRREKSKSALQWCIACAGVAFAFHSFMDFDFYMVGNVWPLFVLLGHLRVDDKE